MTPGSDVSQTRSRPTWTLTTFGDPRLFGPLRAIRIEPRIAALLAYLALEGPQPRSKMAGLLWPDAPPEASRSNLRQGLFRLRRVTANDVFAKEELLDLNGRFEVDALLLQQVAAGEAVIPEHLSFEGDFLSTFPMEQEGDFTDWVFRRREETRTLRAHVLLLEARQMEAAGDLDGASTRVRRSLAFEPCAEQAHRESMRLRWLTGDRAGALAAYEECRAVLSRELGVEPSAQTQLLAREIADGVSVHPPATRASAKLPLAIQRPPVLAGREKQWQQMQAAWDEGQSIALGGLPGTGKSRLMQEFLRSQCEPVFFSGRPHDRLVPYGTNARTYRELLQLVGGPLAVPAWVRVELSRIIPSPGERPPPLANDEDKLRFWEAGAELHRVAYDLGFQTFSYDDLQFVDLESASATAYVVMQLLAGGRTPRAVLCYRTGELPVATMELMKASQEGGVLTMIAVEPLPPSGVVELLEGLQVPGVVELASEIAGYTGGNPLFIVETVKHLIETNQLQRGFPDRLPPPERVAAILQRRLDHLSDPAVQLARVVAVMGTGFSLQLAETILAADPLQTIAWWSELESAQIVRNGAFAHDLLYEAVLAGMSPTVRELLHRRAADALTKAGGRPGQIAAHWLQTGDTSRAAEFVAAAQGEARAVLLAEEAATFYEPSSIRNSVR